MYAVCVTVWVKPDNQKDFIKATLENARNTRKESANVRFDVLQSEANPDQFFLYEVYRSPEGFKSHQQTEHYLTWKGKVADWMAQPRQGVRHFSLSPEDAEW
jgi:(4S)-4-hydroxy-5-phosphonooxypentane-2,3-dione isomerase